MVEVCEGKMEFVRKIFLNLGFWFLMIPILFTLAVEELPLNFLLQNYSSQNAFEFQKFVSTFISQDKDPYFTEYEVSMINYLWSIRKKIATVIPH